MKGFCECLVACNRKRSHVVVPPDMNLYSRCRGRRNQMRDPFGQDLVRLAVQYGQSGAGFGAGFGGFGEFGTPLYLSIQVHQRFKQKPYGCIGTVIVLGRIDLSRVHTKHWIDTNGVGRVRRSRGTRFTEESVEAQIVVHTKVTTETEDDECGGVGGGGGGGRRRGWHWKRRETLVGWSMVVDEKRQRSSVVSV